MKDSYMRMKFLEFFIFFSILLVVTALLSIAALYSTDTAPPHAGISVKDDDSAVVISATTMGQSNRISVVANGTVVGEITRVRHQVRVEKTPNKTKTVHIISDNGHRTMLLREMKI